MFRGYLSKIGYLRSLIDPHYYLINEFPWWTLPTLEYLKRKNLTSYNVIEFGSGASTKYLSNRVKKVLSFESDKSWAKNVSKFLVENDVKNVKVEYFEEKSISLGIELHSKEIVDADIIIIDGYDRNLVLSSVLTHLKPSSIIIFDDFDRDDYLPSKKNLACEGYKSIEFWGLSFGSVNLNCTAIFYKPENIFSI